MNEPVVSSTSGFVPVSVSVTEASAANDSAEITARLRRGTSPASLPRASRAGSAPSRPRAAPSLAAPA